MNKLCWAVIAASVALSSSLHAEEMNESDTMKKDDKLTIETEFSTNENNFFKRFRYEAPNMGSDYDTEWSIDKSGEFGFKLMHRMGLSLGVRDLSSKLNKTTDQFSGAAFGLAGGDLMEITVEGAWKHCLGQAIPGTTRHDLYGCVNNVTKHRTTKLPPMELVLEMNERNPGSIAAIFTTGNSIYDVDALLYYQCEGVGAARTCEEKILDLTDRRLPRLDDGEKEWADNVDRAPTFTLDGKQIMHYGTYADCMTHGGQNANHDWCEKHTKHTEGLALAPGHALDNTDYGDFPLFAQGTHPYTTNEQCVDHKDRECGTIGYDPTGLDVTAANWLPSTELTIQMDWTNFHANASWSEDGAAVLGATYGKRFNETFSSSLNVTRDTSSGATTGSLSVAKISGRGSQVSSLDLIRSTASANGASVTGNGMVLTHNTQGTTYKATATKNESNWDTKFKAYGFGVYKTIGDVEAGITYEKGVLSGPIPQNNKAATLVINYSL